MNAFFVPLRSTQKVFKNIVLYFDLIFYRKWVTSIYNADKQYKSENNKFRLFAHKRNTVPEGTGTVFPIQSITLRILGLLEEGLVPFETKYSYSGAAPFPSTTEL